MSKELLSKLMLQAWQFVKSYNYTMSKALKCAWANLKVKAALLKGYVKFTFKKVSGEIRTAIGTLANIPIQTFSNKNRAKSDSIQTYFDIERNEFRCFHKELLISIV